MAKKIAVLVRDRQHEALRVAVGLTLADDKISVFIINKKLESDENIALNIETLNDLGVKIFSNNSENNFEQMSIEEIAKALTGYDLIVPY